MGTITLAGEVVVVAVWTVRPGLGARVILDELHDCSCTADRGIWNLTRDRPGVAGVPVTYIVIQVKHTALSII